MICHENTSRTEEAGEETSDDVKTKSVSKPINHKRKAEKHGDGKAGGNLKQLSMGGVPAAGELSPWERAQWRP